MKVLLLVLVLGLALSDASPILRQLRRLIHVKRQEEACVSAANNVGQVLDRIEMWDPWQFNSEMSMKDLLKTVAPIDIFDGSERQNLLCSLDGLATVSEAVSVLDDRGVLQNDVRALYAAFVASTRINKHHKEEWLQDPPEWMTEEYLQHMLLANQLTTNLEASMAGSYEPEMVNTMMKMMSNGDTSMDDYVVTPPSPQPLDQQCAVIANDVRKLWNYKVQEMQQWDPNYGDNLREAIHEWTGLSFGDHGQMRQLICDVLEIVVNEGPDGLYEFLMSEGIIDRVANKGYPYLQQVIGMARQQLDHMISFQPPADGNSYDNQYSYGGGPNPQLTEMFRIVKDLLDNLEAMGLFSLS